MLKIYNSLGKKIEEFKPINHPKVGVYSCGPTVYDYSHIGHMRKFVGDDLLVRILKLNNYSVYHVMNITDVGHLVSDQDTGEDKMEKGSKKYGMSVWDIAKKFEGQFWDSVQALNIETPDVVMHATDYIQDQINLIKKLEEKGYVYKLEDGLYFDSSKFKNYSMLVGASAEEKTRVARTSEVEGKKHISDFALWKFSLDSKRQMEWKSPWGMGFPGWHVECSAMSIKVLGSHFDIHTGGIDHIMPHHSNEIAQSEAATGQKFVNYWVHFNFLTVNGKKMSKSLNNFYTVEDVEKKGFDPLALRYLYCQVHYRQEMNFTWEALDGAWTALKRLRREIGDLASFRSGEKGCKDFEDKFVRALNDDLNVPYALGIMWELIKSKESSAAKASTLIRMDDIFNFIRTKEKIEKSVAISIPVEVLELVKKRDLLREQKRYHLADQLRNKIKKMGYELDDSFKESKIYSISKPKRE